MNQRRGSSPATVDGFGLNQDSGYNSQSDLEFGTDAEASYYQQMMNEFEAEGVTLSNPSDETKAMMEAELERWEQ